VISGKAQQEATGDYRSYVCLLIAMVLLSKHGMRSRLRE
jgi:hypothetical protein